MGRYQQLPLALAAESERAGVLVPALSMVITPQASPD
jgi:hypothetical protein